MRLPPRIVLHSPVSDDGLLEAFVEQCLADNVSLLAIVGPGADALEEKIDWLVAGEDGHAPDRSLCTTSHSHEPLAEVMAMVRSWDSDGDVAELRL